MKTIENITCFNCHKVFTAQRRPNRDRYFCSTECYRPHRVAVAKFPKGHIPWVKGKIHLPGSLNPNWKGGITSKKQLIRSSYIYKMWRRSVMIRDHFMCRKCGKVGGDLQADHILPFAYYPTYRFDINNGRTLCVPCHEKTKTFRSGAIKFAPERIPQ